MGFLYHIHHLCVDDLDVSMIRPFQDFLFDHVKVPRRPGAHLHLSVYTILGYHCVPTGNRNIVRCTRGSPSSARHR